MTSVALLVVPLGVPVGTALVDPVVVAGVEDDALGGVASGLVEPAVALLLVAPVSGLVEPLAAVPVEVAPLLEPGVSLLGAPPVALLAPVAPPELAVSLLVAPDPPVVACELELVSSLEFCVAVAALSFALPLVDPVLVWAATGSAKAAATATASTRSLKLVIASAPFQSLGSARHIADRRGVGKRVSKPYSPDKPCSGQPVKSSCVRSACTS